jgi:5-methylcytosine-specific restriction endonuclease McrA
MRKYKIQKWLSQDELEKRAENAKRRSLKLGLKGFFTRKTVKNLFVKQKGRCVCCGELLQKGYEVDHIIPLSKGGTNYPNNLQLLTKNCNRKKSNKAMKQYVGGKYA